MDEIKEERAGSREKLSAPEMVLHGKSVYEGTLPGEKRHYWGMLHSLVERLVVVAASADKKEADAAKATLAVWSRDLYNDAGEFAREDVAQLVKKHQVAETLTELWSWERSTRLR